VTKKNPLYEHAGIVNQAEFYGNLYASGELLHPDYFHALERFHIRWARTVWIFDNVVPNSLVLDLGSGAGLLALLKRKDITLVGVDLSQRCAWTTQRNGYDLGCTADLKALPFKDACFDYVVSLDVMGHIEFHQKDIVLAEICRVLKPKGITMHGIETMNTERRKDYDQMTADELKRFVQIEGHVGMESATDTKDRFSRFFSYVLAEPRFSVCQSAEELIKQADEYCIRLCDDDLLDYLRGLSYDERRAFNMAMGYVFQQISDLGIRMPSSEYLFLKASNSALGSFYNEHADRGALQSSNVIDETTDLNQTRNVTFDGDWYAAENFPPIGRWMRRRAGFHFISRPFAKLSFHLVTHIPDVASHPLQVEILLNGVLQRSSVMTNNEPQLIVIRAADLPKPMTLESTMNYSLEIKADRTWQPRPEASFERDDREISVAVFGINLEC
jgi:ubiquinone/menaquinone biosynthesis C-methylase UbiE